MTTPYCCSCLITTLQHLLLFETMALKMAALSVKKVYYTTFRLFLSSTTTPQETYRFSSDHRSQVLLGGVSTWLGDHLGIRRVVGFCTNFGFFRQYFHTLHIIVPCLFELPLVFFVPQVGSMHMTTPYCCSCLITTLQHLLLFETMALKMAALSVKKVYYTTFGLFLSSTTTPQETYRFSSDHRSQVLLGGVSTWLGDHLGIRRVVGFCTNFGFFRQYFHTPPHHRSLSFRTAFSFFCSASW